MKFRELLTHYRERSGLNKTELAQKINVDPTYIMNLEKGQTRKPPTIERCREIAKVLGLSTEERQRLIDSAIEERVDPEVLEWLIEKQKGFTKADVELSREILEALQNPIARKALLVTNQSSNDLKKTLQDILENIQNLTPDEQRIIRKLCHD